MYEYGFRVFYGNELCRLTEGDAIEYCDFKNNQLK